MVHKTLRAGLQLPQNHQMLYQILFPGQQLPPNHQMLYQILFPFNKSTWYRVEAADVPPQDPAFIQHPLANA